MLLDLIKLNNFRENKKYNDINYLPLLIPNGEVIMRKLGLKDYYLYDDIYHLMHNYKNYLCH
jgi:hypothetical protein